MKNNLNNNIIQFPVNKPTKIYEKEQAVNKLKDMELTIEFLINVLIAGIHYKENKSKYAPPLDKNTAVWSGSIIKLREEKCPNGWIMDDYYGFNKTINPGKYSITLSSGDRNVASYINPKSKNTKGAVSEAAVDKNNVLQLSLLDFHSYDLINITQDKYKLENIPHWFLLYYYDNNILKAELSLPNYFDINNLKIVGWAERILLPTISKEEIIRMSHEEIQPLCDNKSDIDFTITKK